MIKYKVCCTCGINKAFDQYHPRPERPIGIKPSCKECSNKVRKKHYEKEKESGVLKTKLWKRVGINISIEEYKVKYDALDGKCEICQCKFDVLCVDHKHTDGTLRGLLCTPCNLALANFKDSETNMKNAIKYLEKYGVDYE
jgi:hypothetical protein